MKKAAKPSLSRLALETVRSKVLEVDEENGPRTCMPILWIKKIKAKKKLKKTQNPC
jgi:hypothetical protein